jgi:hypothetical protein
MYRKPTTMDTTINYISNHPMEHILAAYRYYINGMITLPLNKENRNKEWKIILNIAHNNNFPYKRINELKNQIQNNKSHHRANNSANKKKRVTFTYSSPQIRKLTNLFKHTDLKIAFKNKNTICTP